jgi:hypothetical protein
MSVDEKLQRRSTAVSTYKYYRQDKMYSMDSNILTLQIESYISWATNTRSRRRSAAEGSFTLKPYNSHGEHNPMTIWLFGSVEFRAMPIILTAGHGPSYH